MDLGLKGRVAIVAASTKGIGRATVEKLAAEGCDVALCGREQSTVDEAVKDLRRRYGVRVLGRAVDVTRPEQVDSFVQAVGSELGSISICVTNAGGPPAKPFPELTPDDWRRAFELNLLSTVVFCHAVIPWMQKQKWGRIVTITSLSVRQPVQDLILSNSIRTGVVGLVKSLSNLYGRDGILINNVGPGYASTDRLVELAKSRSKAAGVAEDEIFHRWAEDTATGKIATPEDVADAIVWLASERAASITGQTVLVDNGTYRGL